MKRHTKFFLLFVAGAFSAVAFQNCSNSDLHFADDFYSSNLNYFNYKYTAASPYYHDIKVLKGPEQSNNKTFQVIGSITRSSPEDVTPISWKIRLLDSNGDHLPTIEGNSTDDGTTIYEIGLTGLAGRVYTTLWVEIRYGGQVFTHQTSVGAL